MEKSFDNNKNFQEIVKIVMNRNKKECLDCYITSFVECLIMKI